MRSGFVVFAWSIFFFFFPLSQWVEIFLLSSAKGMVDLRLS